MLWLCLRFTCTSGGACNNFYQRQSHNKVNGHVLHGIQVGSELCVFFFLLPTERRNYVIFVITCDQKDPWPGA